MYIIMMRFGFFFFFYYVFCITQSKAWKYGIPVKSPIFSWEPNPTFRKLTFLAQINILWLLCG